LGVREPDDFDHAFAEMTHERPDAILMVCPMHLGCQAEWQRGEVGSIGRDAVKARVRGRRPL
jgi:hypothetical protein